MSEKFPIPGIKFSKEKYPIVFIFFGKEFDKSVLYCLNCGYFFSFAAAFRFTTAAI